MQPAGGKIETDTKLLAQFSCNKDMDTVKPALPEVPMVLDGTIEEKPLMTRSFVTSQMIDL